MHYTNLQVISFSTLRPLYGIYPQLFDLHFKHLKSNTYYTKRSYSFMKIHKYSTRRCDLQTSGSLYTLNTMTISNYFSKQIDEPLAYIYRTYKQGPVLMDPACKVAIVLGASKGTGYRAAEELLKAGVMRVVMADSNCYDCCSAAQKLCTKFGPEKAVFIADNFCDSMTYVRLFEETIARYQKVDILFNNLDIFNDHQWAEEINCNIKNVIRSTLLAHHYMNKKRNKDLRGSVVINCAIYDSLDTFPPMPIFCATQSAIVGFSRSIGDVMHQERTGVRVVALCPGVSKEHIVSSSESTVQLNCSWGLDVEKLSSKDGQSDSAVGYGVVDLVRYAPTGSVWVINNNKELFYADIPDRSLYNKPGPGSLRPSYCTAPILVPKPQRRPSSSDARSYKSISKLHSYRVKGNKRKVPSQK